MQTLFDTASKDAIIARILQLQPHSLSLWGKMTVSQMLEHCHAPLRVANGSLVLKPSLMGFFFGKSAKKQLLHKQPFGRNLPTAKAFRVRYEPNFENARYVLIQLIEGFASDKDFIKSEKHPFFGKLSKDEWDLLQWKHLDHHLRQFGV